MMKTLYNPFDPCVLLAPRGNIEGEAMLALQLFVRHKVPLTKTGKAANVSIIEVQAVPASF